MADRNTMQKEIIHQTLREMGCHPTAAMVYDRVHRDHPTISRSTEIGRASCRERV